MSYLGHELLARDIENLRAAVADHPTVEVFMTAASPGVIEMFMPNHHYRRDEDYLLALADAMKEECGAIAAAGFLVQLDCPDLAAGWEHQPPGTTLAEFRRQVATRLELIDYATRDIPPERLRMHLCWETTRDRTTMTCRWPTSSISCCARGRPSSASRPRIRATSTSGQCSRMSRCRRARS